MVSVFLFFGGCGADLARLETEEQALAREVEVLRRNVDEMRTQMEEMGLRPQGPAAGAQDLAGAGEDLDHVITVTLSRSGTPPTFAPLGKPERRENTECGYRFSVPWLEGLSDQRLDESGAGKSSPIQLLLDGKPLEPHATPVGAEKACKFAFSHRPKYLFATPENTVDNIEGTWTLGLSPDVPMPKAEGPPAHWVYPGTTLTVSFATGWDGEQWGTPAVKLDARNIYVGTPDNPAANSGGPSVVSFLGKESESRELQVGLEEVVEPPDGPWTIEISSPSDGPYVFVDTLVVGNDLHRRVVIADAGGK